MSLAPEAQHYDRVTESWMRWVMGDDLHFGHFAETKDLSEASRALTTHMIQLLELQPGLLILDVGCGVGTTSLRLAEDVDAEVLGFSTSAAGIAIAQRRREGHVAQDRVQFVVADAIDNQLDAEGFDRVLLLESLHMMPDKEAVMAECFRVLKPGGRLVLCDVCLVSGFNDQMVYYLGLGHSTAVAARMRTEINELMRSVFGPADLDNIQHYENVALQAGFHAVETEDLSRVTRPTLDHWANNALKNESQIVTELGEEYLHRLMLALLNMSIGWGKLGGYLSLTATKPYSSPKLLTSSISSAAAHS